MRTTRAANIITLTKGETTVFVFTSAVSKIYENYFISKLVNILRKKYLPDFRKNKELKS